MRIMIFEHMDPDGDCVQVFTGGREFLRVAVKSADEQSYPVYLDRDATLSLRNVLTERLHGLEAVARPAAPQADNSVIDQLIRRAVTAEVAKVLPLHLAPLTISGPAERCDGVDCCAPHPVDPEPDAEDGWIRSDPEPHDVGHPEPEPLCGRTCPPGAHKASRCTFCGHLWVQHAQTPVPGCTCAHAKARHRREYDGCAVCGCEYVSDKCTSCGMPWPHVLPHPLFLCSCGHCSRQHAGSGGYGECGVAGCECGKFRR